MESDDEGDECNLSEEMTVHQTPKHKIDSYMVNNKNKDLKTIHNIYSETTSLAHTRANSSKAQSLRGSVVIQKPYGSHYSSIVGSNGGPQQHEVSQRTMNLFLRESFTGVIPEGGKGLNLI